MSKDLRFRSGLQLLPASDGTWKQQQNGGPVAWLRFHTKHRRGLWALVALVIVLLVISSAIRFNDSSVPAAAALVTRSNLVAANELLQSATFSNPHSRSPCGLKTTQALEEAVQLVLKFFNADPKQYTIIWTSGATQGLKMVGEYFPWTSGPDWTCSGVVPAGGVSDKAVGKASKCGPVPPDAQRATPRSSHFVYLSPQLTQQPGNVGQGNSRLLVHAKSMPSHRWLVVADAAAYVPTHKLDLSVVQPDFVPISFYKMFGFPTGLGALIARRESLSVLRKVYFGGGSVLDATAEDVWRLLSPPPAGFEDGTRDFLGITQLQFGFKQLQQLGGMQAIHEHTSSLQAWTFAALRQLRHSNGQPLVQLFGRHDEPSRQSCVFQFLVLQPDGAATSQVVVEEAAFDAGLAIRTGCMCNPGQCLFNLGIKPEEERAVSITGTDCSSGFMVVQRPAKNDSSRLVSVELPIGTIRASLGYLSTFEDCYALIDF
ncbi:pyridoxal phosphate-dependent transferase [Scenedesmus sp. NREL 46B-D3]|nr:pyridoxal phosphate-dependent transferase [Scenedesmus sp. NREL 46B-D3]